MKQPAGSNVPTPYLAPWASNWNKYSTQIFKMPLNSTQSANIVVPVSQWWRIIYCAAEFNTLAVAGTRVIHMSFTDSQTQTMELATSTGTSVNTTALVTFGVGLNTVAAPSANGNQYLAVNLLDLLWKPKTQIAIDLQNGQTGDTLVGTPALAVEVYTEYTSPASTPVLIPSPALT